jgi:hypothetical protein
MGRREEETKRRQAEMEKEKIEQLKLKLADLGLEDKEIYVPPDDIDEKSVQKSMLNSLLSIIPYTNAWYEAKAAEEEMNDLRKIRIEKVKANDLLALARIPGRHDEALQKLMSETDRDFHYFNRLRCQKISEGKFTPFPEVINPFKEIERGRNRIKKAVKKPFAMMDDSLLKAVAKPAKPITQAAKKFSADAPCSWR